MSAADHLQLAMFYPAGDLADPKKFGHYDVEHRRPRQGESEQQRYDRVRDKKVEEARTGTAFDARDPIRALPGAGTLYESIQKHGVRQPVDLWTSQPPHYPLPMLGEGHHRVFTSATIDPAREIPVKWQEG